MKQSQSHSKKKEHDWFGYLTEDMDREPKDPAEMMGLGFRAIIRTLHFLGWIYWKTLGFAFKGIREVYRMVLGRGKAKKKKEEVQQVPFRNPSPPVLPSELATSGLGIPQQPQYPQPQYPQQQPPMQPIPPAPAPPMQVPQQVEPARAVVNPFIQIEKSFEQIRESFSHIYDKIMDMEVEIDDIYNRLNMLQGVQPRPEKRIVFRHG